MDPNPIPEGEFEALQERLAAAREEGQSMGQLLQMAAESLAEQPREGADPGRQELIAQLQLLQTQAPLLEKMASAENPEQGFGALMQMYANLEAARPESGRQAQRKEALARFARLEEEQQQRNAEHVQERLAQGLSAQAGTGAPYPQVLLLEEESDAEDTPEIGLGASRLGGVPDLPPGVEWPTYQGKKLPFLAQIDLAEAAAAQKTVLPVSGWLYAFGLFDNEEDHWPSPVAVFHYDAPRTALVRAAEPAEDEIWPDWTDQRVYELVPLTASRGSGGDERPQESAGWLFGEMDGVFGTPGEIADDAMLEGADWVNLLALESAGSMEWSDCGHLYLLARRSDLEKLDFSRVYGAICSS